MEDFLTNEAKLDLVQRESRSAMDANGMVIWNDCVSILQKASSTSSKTEINELLSDFDDGDGKVEAGTLKTIAAHLLLEENGKAQGSIDDELPDTDEKKRRLQDFMKSMYTLLQNGNVDMTSAQNLAQQHKVKLGD